MPFKTMSKILQPNMVFNTILNMASLLTMYLSNKLARPYFDLKIALNFEADIKFYMDIFIAFLTTNEIQCHR